MIPIREFMGESNPTFDHGTYEAVFKNQWRCFLLVGWEPDSRLMDCDNPV